MLSPLGDPSYEYFPRCRGFKIAALNVNSLSKHNDELRIILNDNVLDVLAINEAKLDDTVSDGELFINGYDIVRRDRAVNGRRGGGVCFYVRSNIDYFVRNDLSSDILEILSIEIRKPNARPFVITTWYRPPDSPVELFSHFETVIGKLDSEGIEHVVLGDMNADYLSPSDSTTKALLNVTVVYNLKQLINEPTRITEKSRTAIDLIFTSHPEGVVCSGVSHLGISDHSLIYVYRKLAIPPASKGVNTVVMRDFKHFDSDSFRNDISSLSWDCINDMSDPNAMWSEWKSLFLSVCNKHAPIRTRRTRAYKSPWINSELKSLIHFKKCLKIKAIQSNDPVDWNAFKRFRNSLNEKIMNAKNLYYTNSFRMHEGNSRKTWNTINQFTGRKANKSAINSIDVNGEVISSPAPVAEAFNTYFSEIGPKLAKNVKEANVSFEDYLSPTEKCFQLQQTNRQQVLSLLSKLAKSKATGLDNISARLLRECLDLIASSLSTIFNQSIVSGIFPSEWKNARVIPLYKNAGKRSDLSNYRPISIIPIIAKVFERIVYNQFYAYLNSNNLITGCQSGFRSMHSTVTALLEATDSWSLNIDKGCVNAVVFLDLKKAFDTVDHNILLSKLTFFGLQGPTLHWFASYLENRSQVCHINGLNSSPAFLKCGVPQGTILGPLLFLLYINDLPNCLSHSQPRMYADDTSITFVSNDLGAINLHMNEDLGRINSWLTANKLTLNMTKTEFLLIGSRQRLASLQGSPRLAIDGTPVNPVSCTKSLGVMIDKNLSWEEHITTISKKISSGIGAIKRIRAVVPRGTLLMAYNAIVQPHFDYCSSVWGDCAKGLADRLQKLQNRAARIITFSNYDANAETLFQELGWYNLSSQRNLSKSLLVYKTLNNLTPGYLTSRFTWRENSGYNLRDSVNKLQVPLPRTEYGKRSFSYSGAVLWNNLPVDLRANSPSLSGFKAGVLRTL